MNRSPNRNLLPSNCERVIRRAGGAHLGVTGKAAVRTAGSGGCAAGITSTTEQTRSETMTLSDLTTLVVCPKCGARENEACATAMKKAAKAAGKQQEFDELARIETAGANLAHPERHQALNELVGVGGRVRTRELPVKCQKCGLVAGVVIGYVDEVNGVRIGRAAWCCPRCVNRALERIEQLEALVRAMNRGGKTP